MRSKVTREPSRNFCRSKLTAIQVAVKEIPVKSSMVTPAVHPLAKSKTDSDQQVYREPGLSDAEYEKIKRNML